MISEGIRPKSLNVGSKIWRYSLNEWCCLSMNIFDRQNCQLAHGTVVHVIVTSTNDEEAPTAQVHQEQASFSSTTNLIGPSHYGISTQTGN